jgi:hypothetical protein
VGGQFQRDGTADAPARAGDNGNLILKLFHGSHCLTTNRLKCTRKIMPNT